MLLAKYIREQRLKSALTQQEACELLGYKSSQFLSNLERGTSKPPLETLKKMCEVYEVCEQDMRNMYIEQARVEAESKAVRRWDLKKPTAGY